MKNEEDESFFRRTIRAWSKSPFLVLLVILFYIAFYFFFGILGSISFGVLKGSAFIDILCAILALIVLTSFTPYGCDLFDSTGHSFKDKTTKEIGIILIVVTFICLYFIGQIFGTMIFHLGDASFAHYKQESQAPYWATFFLSVIVAPICEELFYRGAIYYTLKRAYSMWLAIIIQALIFAFMHGTKVHLPGTIALAIFNALLLELTGKFRYNILTHMTYNLVATLPTGLMIPNVLMSWPVVIVSYILLLAVLAYFYIYLQEMPVNLEKTNKNWLEKLYL